LFPPYIERLKEVNDATYAEYQLNEQLGRFEASVFIPSVSRYATEFLRPFYGLDGTHTRSKYGMTLLILVGINRNDEILPLAWALVPVENQY
jgi:hypothetical protein